LALLGLIVGRTTDPALRQTVTAEHASAIGKLVLTFAIFWAYTSFSQLLIIWIADVPDEVTWYVPRITGSWLAVGLAVAIAQFGVPFALMLSYTLKRQVRVLAMLGGWLLAAHYVEMYWIVMPQLHPATARPHWLDLSAAATVIGAAVSYGLWRARGHATIAVGDPELGSSLRYVET
jgi:hypothetical protein